MRTLLATLFTIAGTGVAAAGNQAPPPPTLSVPYHGSTVAVARPPFVVENVIDPDGDPLTYELELATDDTFATIERRVTGAPRPGAGHTILELAADLAEDSHHCWRVRARDGQVAGPASAACFRVSAVNDPPTAPRPLSPLEGDQMYGLSVTFGWAGAVDPEGGPLTYQLEIDRPENAIRILLMVGWELHSQRLGELDRTLRWSWHVRAVDDQGAVSEPTPVQTFETVAVEYGEYEDPCGGCRVSGSGAATLVVGLALIGLFRRRRRAAIGGLLVLAALVPRPAAAAPPAAPVIVSPARREVVPTLHPVLVTRQAIDDDGDPLVYDWDLASDSLFVAIQQRGVRVGPSGGGFAGFDLTEPLVENGAYCWRVRARDGQAAGPFATACFVASAVNEPPAAPVPNNPSDNIGASTTRPVFSWGEAIDPEGEPVTYQLEIRDLRDQLVAVVGGLHGPFTIISIELANRESYQWRIRAIDRSGQAGPFSPPNSFTINAPVDNYIVVCHSGRGGGCGASHPPGAGAALAALGLCALRRRRGQSPGERSRGTR